MMRLFSSRRESVTEDLRARAARSRDQGHPGPAPVSELELSQAAQKSVALAQQEKSAWTRADLIKYLGRVLPRSGRDPAAAAVLLEDLAGRTLRSEFEPVACTYQRHGGVRYATHAQLSLEERIHGACGPVPLRPGDLVLMDEGSMAATPDPPRPGPSRPRGNHRRRRHGQPRGPDHLHPQRPHGQAGEPGRTLANGDLLRIDAVTRRGLVMRRALDADPATGQRRTVTAGLAVITGAEDRPHALVALTRGTTTNLAYVFTQPPKRAVPVPGPRPAPDLARYDNKRAERSGVPAPPISSAPPGQALAVLAAVLDRDGQLLSATQVLSCGKSTGRCATIPQPPLPGDTCTWPRPSPPTSIAARHTESMPPAERQMSALTASTCCAARVGLEVRPP